MRFYTKSHRHYCGIDLHARTMYLCILDHEGEILLHRNIKCEPAAFLAAVAPYRDDLVVGVECIFTWYWLADLCAEENIAFVLGHALYMRAIHGGKVKNDRVDSQKIAMLLRGGMFPQAYVYPVEMRSTRDLMRRRLFLVRQRGHLAAHIQNSHYQYNIAVPAHSVAFRSKRSELSKAFKDDSARKSIDVDLALIADYDRIIHDIELYIMRQATIHDPGNYQLLRTFPGVGKIMALTLLYEIHDINRFPRVQEFASYARLIRCTKESAGKKLGTTGAKMGNVHLKWAFSEAAVLFLRHDPMGGKLMKRIQRKHPKGKALSILAHKIGRTVYYMMKRRTFFDLEKFMNT